MFIKFNHRYAQAILILQLYIFINYYVTNRKSNIKK